MNDWIYDLAVIADGGRPQKSCKLPLPQIEDSELVSLLLSKLTRVKSTSAIGKMALALARLGWSGPELTEPLIGVLRSKDFTNDSRDEALLWLSRCGGRPAAEALLVVAREPPDDPYGLSARALFGLIAIGDFDLITSELAKGSKASGKYCDEFALAAVGLEDLRGAETVMAWTKHEDEVVRNACMRAVKKAAIWRGEDVSLLDASLAEDQKELTQPQKVIASKTVCVLLVRGENTAGSRIFAYMAVRADRLENFIAAQKTGTFYPEDFGIVIESGEGEPGEEVREKMQREYGFNHEAMLDIPDTQKAISVAGNITYFANETASKRGAEISSDDD
jgi:hypothetical protein